MSAPYKSASGKPSGIIAARMLLLLLLGCAGAEVLAPTVPVPGGSWVPIAPVGTDQSLYNEGFVEGDIVAPAGVPRVSGFPFDGASRGPSSTDDLLDRSRGTRSPTGSCSGRRESSSTRLRTPLVGWSFGLGFATGRVPSAAAGLLASAARQQWRVGPPPDLLPPMSLGCPDSQQCAILMKAMDNYHDRSCIRFKEWTGEDRAISVFFNQDR